MFNDIFDELTKVFNGVSKDAVEAYRNMRQSILINVSKTESAYLVEAQIPGVSKEDVEINYDNSVLTISVREQKNEQKYLLQERPSNYSKRSIELQGVDPTQIKARLENGILGIVLPLKKKDNTLISIE